MPLERTTVLVRADYNVPLNDDGSIRDDFRIRASLPTIKQLLKDGCKVVIISHLGRPEGRDAALSLEPAALRLAELLGKPVRFVDKTIGPKVKMAIKKAPNHSVTVLENLRFHAEEEANDEAFAKRIAQDTGAKYFVQDGFGVVHRDHASTAAITLYLPSVAGLLLQKEYMSIVGAMERPKRPLVAVIGGAKVSDKIQVVDRLVEHADAVLVGGAMANTFLAAKGFLVGASKYEADQAKTVKRVYREVEKKSQLTGNNFFITPIDVVTTKQVDAVKTETKSVNSVEADDIILDIGEQTSATYGRVIAAAKTVIWNGTMGFAENKAFKKGSAAIAKALVDNPKVESIIGGGDTADFAIHWDARNGRSYTHVSTGGGASLELMAGEKLPGVEHLLDA